MLYHRRLSEWIRGEQKPTVIFDVIFTLLIVLLRVESEAPIGRLLHYDLIQHLQCVAPFVSPSLFISHLKHHLLLSSHDVAIIIRALIHLHHFLMKS